MTHRQGGHRTKGLVFPSNWTGKWLYRAVINTPKWQLQSILNSYKFNQWIAFESMALNGLQLSPRVDPETNFVRSIEVGIAVSQAGKDYEAIPHKVPLEEKVELLKEELETPIIGDMIKQMTEANIAPMMEPTTPPPYHVELVEPNVKVSESGEKLPVITVG